MQAEVSDHLHELGKFFYIIYNLCLYEISAIRHLLTQPGSPEFKWPGKGIGSGSKEKAAVRALDVLTALELLFVAHVPYHAQQLDGVHVKDAFGAGMIAELLMISSKAEQIFQSQGADAPRISLCMPMRLRSRQVIWITGSTPSDRVKQAGADTGHSDNSCLAVGNVDRVDIAF